MFRLIILALFILMLFKWGDYKRWKEFYPTILFTIIGDFTYNFVFCNYMLWRYDGLINHTVSDILMAVVAFPCAIIVFLTHLPVGWLKQAVYILVWSAANLAVEYISSSIGFMSYSNGWNIFWSIGVYIGAFIIICIHYKRPLAAWLISGVMLITVALAFKLPFLQLK